MWSKFTVGFWHPFGPYTGQTTAEVLDWKIGETKRNGWTFWSFAYASAGAWLKHINDVTGPVYALCSFSPGARDPDKFRGTRLATHYRYLAESKWRKMPDPKIMKVTNPFKRRGLALAFKVGSVIVLEPDIPPFAIEWYCKGEQRWRSEKLPTRGEFLVRRGGRTNGRPVSTVLELVPPYLAVLKHEAG